MTGGVVRLTGSGLGCPTWPSCTEQSSADREYAEHGAIEFGNRMLTFAVRRSWWPRWSPCCGTAGGRWSRSGWLLPGIPAQAMLGGITVLTGLNPWTVAAHFLLSMAILAVAVVPPGGRSSRSGRRGRCSARSCWRSGRWSGGRRGAGARHRRHRQRPARRRRGGRRTGFDPATVSQLHADAVILLVGLTVAVALWLRAAGAPAEARRAAAVLLVVELAQGVVGFVQYFTGLPVLWSASTCSAPAWSGSPRSGCCWLPAPGPGRPASRRRRRDPSTPRPERPRGLAAGAGRGADTAPPRSGAGTPSCGRVRHQRRVAGGPAPPGPGRRRAERHQRHLGVRAQGPAADLFWPWFAANISVLGVSYGAFVLGFGVSFRQAAIAGVVGIVVSFTLCGLVAMAGKRGSAPTMVLSRAAFGVRGNRLPAALSWLLTVGWETVLVILATLATATVLDRLGWGGGTGTKLLAMVAGGGRHDRRRRARLRLHHAAADRDHVATAALRWSTSCWSPTRSAGTPCPPCRPDRRRPSSARWCS